MNVKKLCSSDNTRIIYNGTRIPEAYDKAYYTEREDRRINFCAIGRLSPYKNQIMAIEACAKLKAITDNFTLHLLGKADKEGYTEVLKNKVTSLGLDDNVKFWGFRSDVDELLKTMDVGLILSQHEAFGRVTVEYMSHYMPVIGTNTGGTPEIVLDGETGYLCPLNDSDTLAQLMHKFIAHPELLKTMGEKGRERAVTHFSLEHNTDQIYSLYREILGL